MPRRVAALTLLGSTLLAGPARAADCADCDGNGTVSINELISGITIALGGAELAICPAVDRSGNGAVTIDELVAAIANALYGCAPTASPTPTATPRAAGMPAATTTPAAGPISQLPPADAAALIAWLEAGSYRGWQAESGPHAGRGPHFGVVRTFVNGALFDSLSAAAAQHPTGGAAVKELYGSGTATVRGWAVMRKVQDDSDAGRGWYWYEYFNGSGGGGIGDTVCMGCHATGQDFIRIPFPLQ